MSFLKVLVSIAALAFFISCHSGSEDSNPAANPTPTGSSATGDDGLTVEQAKKRWPESGSFSTSFNDNGCKDTYDYGNLADYCMALTDNEKSNCPGNLSVRKMAYKESCGDDFEPRNIGAYRISGYDSHLKKQCDIGSDQRFSTVKKLCDFTKNEELHRGCFWKERQNYFILNNCKGDFSAQPPAGVETLVTPPTSTPVAVPAAPAKDAFKILYEKLARLGIQLKIQPDRLDGYIRGNLTFKEKLKKFIPVLDQFVQELVLRQAYITVLTIAEYTSYDLPGKSLDLDVGLSKEGLAAYFLLLDKRISLEESTGVEVDYSLESFLAEKKQDPFEGFKQKLEYFISKKQSLKSIQPLINKIKITSTNFFSPFENSLSLSEDDYSAQFNKDLTAIIPLAKLAQNGIQFSGYNDLSTDFDAVSAFATWASTNKTGLTELVKIYGGLNIEIHKTNDPNRASFYPSSKSLHVYVPSGQFNAPALNSLMKITASMVQLGIGVELSQYDLGDDFIKSAQLFQYATAKLTTLKAHIKKVEFTSGASTYYEGSEMLTIGSDSTRADLDKLLSGIKK